MIGLLRKDQTLLWSSYGKNFLLVGALYTIMSCLSDSMEIGRASCRERV